jgi:hypothetical protein
MQRLKLTIAFTSKENETMKQGHLINKINRLIPVARAVPMEEWNGDEVGIWFRGSEHLHGDFLVFNGYNPHPDLDKILEEAGWMWEPYDMGTLMAYPN